jgi:hypothetical protein
VSASAASVRRVAGRHRLVRLAAVPPLSVVLAACGGTLPAEDVAGRAEDVLEGEVGVRPDISCPDDLAEEVGAETRCTWTAGDDPTEYGLTITVTAVDGGGADFDVRLDRQPEG